MNDSKTGSLESYLQSTFLLVRSLVIKSEISASRMNDAIIAKYGIDSVDLAIPSTWKYYMNLSGQYHFEDKMMTVTSLDTQEEIEFTVENMYRHTATAEMYRYGTRYYYSLVNKYKDQEQLILAITNPVNIDQAISAKDGTILAYYKDLVEDQEDTLIHDLTEYIQSYLARYTVIGYNNVWGNYPVLNLANLYGSLPAQIMNLRLLACKSSKTHSFHIEQYLASHGQLDKYIPYMTLKQKMYLYHNIDYIMKYAGHTSTFLELIKWILSDRRIPLSSYTIRQLLEHNDHLLPEIMAHRTPLGTMENNAEAEYVPMETLFQKEIATQKGNLAYLDEHIDDISHAFKTSDTSVQQTKDLESAMVDYTDSVPDPLPDVLLKHWAYMSSKGLYDVLVNFNHPTTADVISLPAKEALIYYSYIMMSVMGYRPTYVPSFLDVGYRLHPRPPVELLYKDLLPSLFPDLKDIADQLVKRQPTIRECRSVTEFWELVYKIYEESKWHWGLKASIHDPLKRGIVAKMVSRLYGIESLELVEGDVTIGEWLKERSLPVFDGTAEEGLAICTLIFKKATGYTVDDTKTARAIQRAMVAIFKQLSSYSVQIMREINDSAIIPLNWAAIRIGFRGQDGDDRVKVNDSIFILDSKSSGADKARVEDAGDYVNVILTPAEYTISVPDPIYINSSSGEGDMEYNFRLGLTAVSIESTTSPTLEELNLTDEQRNKIAMTIINRRK